MDCEGEAMPVDEREWLRYCVEAATMPKPETDDKGTGEPQK